MNNGENAHAVLAVRRVPVHDPRRHHARRDRRRLLLDLVDALVCLDDAANELETGEAPGRVVGLEAEAGGIAEAVLLQIVLFSSNF